MSAADNSDNWRRKKQLPTGPSVSDSSTFWNSNSKSYTAKSTSPQWKSLHADVSHQRNRSTGNSMEDTAARHEEPGQDATNEWINFSKQNAEKTPPEWEQDWEKKSVQKRQQGRPTNNKRFFSREEYKSKKHDMPHGKKHMYIHPDDMSKSNRKPLFNAYISPSEVLLGLQDNTFLQGEMRISKNRQDAYVKCDDLDHDIYIGGHKDRNRALQNDLVAVRLLDVDTVWEQRKEREAEMAEKRKLLNKSYDGEQGLVQDAFEEDDESAEDDESVEDNKPKFCGEVVAIIERQENTTYSGTIMVPKAKNNGDTTADENNEDAEKPKEVPRRVWFKPNDKRMPLVALFGREVPEDIMEREEHYRTHLFSAEVHRWLITDSNPAGRIIKEIGPIGSLPSEKEAVITDNNIIDTEFSSVALEGLPELPWSIPSVEYDKRLDLRYERVFSIDPITAKDLDDALHVRPLRDGLFEVGVHIADVTYFLKKESPLDTEAADRGTSTYLADRVIPMLPSVLCEQLCSLNPGVDRLAFSVLWVMDKEGKIIKTWYGRTIIKSCAKLAYEHAQEVIEGRNLPNDILIYNEHDAEGISSDIRLLHNMSIHMRQRRKDGGSLSLHSVKLVFNLDSNGEPVSFGQAVSKEANKLIEEFMLCANISVAEKIKSAFPSEALLRRHEKPLERRLDDFIRLTEVLGLDFDGSTAGTLQKSFNQVDNDDVRSILLVLCIRAMQRAKYFCAGALSDLKQIHYALNEPVYTHFTSPIRRYPDVIVHRMLQAALDTKPCGYTKRIVQKTAYSCNLKKLGAKAAQDADTKLYLANYLHNQEQSNGPTYKKGVIIMTGKSQFEVYIPEYGIERKIYMHSLPVKKFSFDKQSLQLTISWKKDIPVTMHNEEKIYAELRTRDDIDDEEDEYDDDMEKLLADGLDHMKLSMATKKIKSAAELIPPVMIDAAECTQCIQMFSIIDVRLQINVDVSPPYINVYPLNPFAEKEV